jgi:hypothetical protein
MKVKNSPRCSSCTVVVRVDIVRVSHSTILIFNEAANIRRHVDFPEPDGPEISINFDGR